MKVTLEQHGGLAAGIRRSPRVVKTDALTGEVAEELARLVEAAKVVPAIGGDLRRARDAMSYTITVEDSGRPVLLRQSDTSMSPAFAALLDWFQKHPEAK